MADDYTPLDTNVPDYIYGDEQSNAVDTSYWTSSPEPVSGGSDPYGFGLAQPTLPGKSDTSISRMLGEWLKDPAARSIAGGAIAGMAGGIFQMLKSSGEQKSAKELLAMKYGLEKQSEADKIARASSMPSVRRMTPAGTSGKAQPTNWQAPALTAAKRGLINS